MKTIYKYPLPLVGRSTIQLPNHAIIRHIGVDPRGDLCLWAEVDPDSPTAPFAVWIFGTGHAIHDEAGTFLGTIVVNGYVWHLYSPDVSAPEDQP